MFAIFNNLLFSSLLDKMKNTITFALEQEERERERQRMDPMKPSSKGSYTMEQEVVGFNPAVVNILLDQDSTLYSEIFLSRSALPCSACNCFLIANVALL